MSSNNLLINQYENIQNSILNEPNSTKQFIKYENIRIYEIVGIIFILVLTIFIPLNIMLTCFNANLNIYIWVNFLNSPIIIIMFFVPIGYNFQFDYINKGIIMNKEYIISCMNNCFKKKNISFNEIKYFKLQTFNFLFITHYNLGYYDINQKFEILFSFPYICCVSNLNELEKKIENLNELLNEENI